MADTTGRIPLWIIGTVTGIPVLMEPYIIYKTPTKLVEIILFLSKLKFHHFSL